MARSNGYRPRKAQREEVERLRKRLGKLRHSEWQRASCIMQEITALLGHQGGPGHGMIEPRSCAACGYYGHTKQWCKKRLAREERERNRSATDEDAEWRFRNGVFVGKGKTDLAFEKWYAWSWRRYEAVRATSAGCERNACGQCEGCVSWAAALVAYEQRDPEPPRTSSFGD